MSHDWGYGPNDGPATWVKHYPIADGQRQSPIDIVTSQVHFDQSLKSLKFQYNGSSSKDILNNGHSFQVTFLDEEHSSILTGGPITGVYKLAQFHFHWGSDDHKGSEHTVNGVKYPCELHLVHWNTKYANVVEAMEKADGLAVVGVFLKIGSSNPKLQKLLDTFDAIKTSGQQTPFVHFDPKHLLPTSLGFWTYEGSLTTPPLKECVTWIVLKEPISVSAVQMAKFRTLLFSSAGEEPHCMCNNFRPPQPLKGRTVRSNFK